MKNWITQQQQKLKKNSNSKFIVVSNMNNVKIQSPVNDITYVSIYNTNSIEINHCKVAILVK